MKLFFAALGATSFCVSSGNIPAPPQFDAGDLCQHFIDIGCAQGAACNKAMAQTQNTTVVWPTACWAAAATPAQAEACRGPTGAGLMCPKE